MERDMVALPGLLIAALALTPLPPPRPPAPSGAEVYFISPVDGDTVGRECVVRFGLRGMGLAPAGINLEKTGHHHLLLDVEQLPDFTYPLPNDDKHRHFGAGQTEVTLELEPGAHTLQLVVGDYLHMAHDPAVMSPKITITVK
jgi:hypothetical protein